MRFAHKMHSIALSYSNHAPDEQVCGFLLPTEGAFIALSATLFFAKKLLKNSWLSQTGSSEFDRKNRSGRDKNRRYIYLRNAHC